MDQPDLDAFARSPIQRDVKPEIELSDGLLERPAEAVSATAVTGLSEDISTLSRAHINATATSTGPKDDNPQLAAESESVNGLADRVDLPDQLENLVLQSEQEQSLPDSRPVSSKERRRAKQAPQPIADDDPASLLSVKLKVRNELILKQMLLVNGNLGTDLQPIDEIVQATRTFMRTMTLMRRFQQVFRARNVGQLLARVGEEDDFVKSYGGLEQLLAMACQTGYLVQRVTKKGDPVFDPTPVGLNLIAPRIRRSPSRKGPSVHLQKQVLQNFESLSPTPASDRIRAKVLRDVQLYLDRQFRGAAFQVELFGSSGNTLYTPNSDLDLCCYYTVIPPLSFISVRQLARSFSRSGFAKKVQCIDHAKIPVVKFVHRDTNLQVDVSIENAIAIENTILIRTYAELDERFRVLAFALKTWCKRRCISNPSEGTLSSYSWTLMLIHYLQQTSPPVLPNLQDDSLGADNIQEYAHSHMGKLVLCSYNSQPSFKSENEHSTGSLLLGFFDYYAHHFDFKKHIISISRPVHMRPIKKEMKAQQANCGSPVDWLSKRICIEDPFITTRNTGVGCAPLLADWTENEILRAFQILDDGGSFADIVEFGMN